MAVRASQETQPIIDIIEDELGVQINPVNRPDVDQGLRRRREYALKSPAAVFYEDYTRGSRAKKRDLFRMWSVRYFRRGDPDADQSKLTRRFKQYLSLGKKHPAREARIGGRQVYSLRQGGISRIQLLLDKPADTPMPEYLWVTVYVTKLRALSREAIDFARNDPKANLMEPMLYVGHRRDSKIVRDRVRIQHARRASTTNGLTELTSHFINNNFTFPDDFDFEEIWTLEVLGEVDHGHGLESSNAVQASVLEDLKRIELINAYIDGYGPRPFNAKIDNSLLGVTNIKGLLQNHDTPVANLDLERIRKKLKKAEKKLKRRYEEYKRRFISDSNGVHVLPVVGTTKDGIGQTSTAEFSQARRKRLVESFGL